MPRRTRSGTSNPQQTMKWKAPFPQSYVPSVLLPAEAAKSPAVHKIHILGDDERSKFIAHALSGVYESVEMLGWSRQPLSKYGNISKSTRHRGISKVERSAAPLPQEANADTSRLDQLIVTGSGETAAQALESVKHRVDKDTTICLMTDGLGVLEDVRRKLFEGSDSLPQFLLGHMSHRLAYNRKDDAVKQLRFGQTLMTVPRLTQYVHNDLKKTESRSDFVKSIEGVKDLNSSLTAYDQWLRFKLPSIIFSAVVEPVCVLLDLPYQGLLQNPAAMRMMNNTLQEIINVVEHMPELAESTTIRDFIHGTGIRKLMYSGIMSKRAEPSRLARQVNRGLPTDVDYTNGYFLRRGKQLGLDLKMNTMLSDLIKAKHSLAIERANSYIPIEETSIPSDQSFRYRTSPGKRRRGV